MMYTIKDLIEELVKYPDDMEVKVSAAFDSGFCAQKGGIDYIEKDRVDYAIVLHNDEFRY